MVNFGNDWNEVLAGEFSKDYYQAMRKVLAAEYRTQRIYPHMDDIFNAFKLPPYNGVKAVILGQDPYHGPGQAHGLSFSVKKPVPPPPSLLNMYKELKDDLNIDPPAHGDLTSWASEGVLLLNAVLTVRAGQANSHAGIGWQTFTDNVIQTLNDREGFIVFILWGRNARLKESLITNPRHRILAAAHPSPLSAYNGFFGCGHFAKANGFLKANGMDMIDWRV